MEQLDAVIAGYIGVDIICDFTDADLLQRIKPGQLLEMDNIVFTLGGLVSMKILINCSP